jgi:Zn-dependent peptidase ImmA (M78 family)/transcriptional regulator with XRE-family HTH domain
MKGERIRQAREISGLTQTELSGYLGITQAALAQIEAGVYAPSQSVLSEIASRTGFDFHFLDREEPPIEFPSGSILYRTKAKVSAKDKARAHRLAQLAFELVVTLRQHLKDIPVLIPRITDDPVSAARITRNSLGLSPDTPISNIVSAIERAGVLILPIPLHIEGFDGFSAWVRGTPVICMLAGKIGFRSRFTVSEELAHLIMHHPLRIPVEQAEAEAREFTGEFVLPEEAMRREMIPPVTLASLAPLKNRWRAAYQFLAYRAKELDLLTYNQFRYVMQQVSSRGWRGHSGEPGDADIPQERPRALFKMVEVVYGNPPDWGRLRKETGVPMRLLKALLVSSERSLDAPAQVSIIKSPPKNYGS